MKKNEFLRLTFDVPAEIHMKLKTFAARKQKSMRSILIELIDNHVQQEQQEYHVSAGKGS